MFASSTFVLAAISVLARVAVATPPACLIGAVGAQANPADMKTLCGSSAMAVEGNITSLCTGDASSQAMSIFSSTCLAAGVTISVSSSTASSSDSSSTDSDSATTTDSTSATGTSKSTGLSTVTATGSSASKTSTSHTGSKGSSSTSTASSSSATGTADSAGFSTSPEHALYLSPLFLGALAYFL